MHPTTRAVVACLLIAFCSTLPAQEKKSSDSKATAASGFPAAYTKLVDGAVRFESADYFRLMAADGITKVDAKALYSRLQAAIGANERYKALYFARVLTQIKPDNAAMWTNRAQLSRALALEDEAAACEQNAKDPGHAVRVPLTDVLPGAGLGLKPTTLADWAAATALLSDGIAEREGNQSLVAFKDSVSGIHEATAAEVQETDNDAREAGLPPSGPWARPEPVQVAHVLGNVFSERAADPMHFKSMSKGGFFGAMAMAGLAGMNQNTNPAAAQQEQEAAQQMAGRASQVPSHYTGGSFTRVTYIGGKESAIQDHPQSAGLDEAVANPVPFLWASGGSMEPMITADWKSNQKMKEKKITTGNLDDMKNSKAKRYNVPDQLQFPKLMGFCLMSGVDSAANCSVPLTLMELLLTPEDIANLAPSLSTSVRDVEMYRNAYGSSSLVLVPGNGGGTRLWGADTGGAVYPLYPKPTSWVVAAK